MAQPAKKSGKVTPKVPSVPNIVKAKPSSSSQPKVPGSDLVQNVFSYLKGLVPTPMPTVRGRDTQIFPPPRPNPDSVLPAPTPRAPQDTRLMPPNPFQNPKEPSVIPLPTHPMQFPASQPDLIPTHPQLYNGETGAPMPPNAPANLPLPTPYDPNGWTYKPTSAPTPNSGAANSPHRQFLQSAVNKAVPQGPQAKDHSPMAQTISSHYLSY